MAKQPAFDIVTPDRLERTQPEIDWDLCFLCQNDVINNLQYPCPRRVLYVSILVILNCYADR